MNEVNKFPIEVFHPQLQEEIKETSRLRKVPVNVVSSYMLNLLGYSLANKFYVKINPTWEERSNLWTLIVGDSGSGKTPLFNDLTAPIKRLDVKLGKIYKERMRQFIEYKAAVKKGGALEKSLDKAKTPDDRMEIIEAWCVEMFEIPYYQYEAPTRLESYLETATFAAITKVLSDDYNNGRCVSFMYDEFVGFTNTFDQYSKGSDEQTMMKLHGYGSMKVKRVDDDRTLYIKDRTVSVVGTTQPFFLYDIITRDRLLNGFSYRFLFDFEEEEVNMRNVFNREGRFANPYVKYIEMLETFLSGYEYEMYERDSDGNEITARIELTYGEDIERFLDEWNINTREKNALEGQGVETNEYTGIMGKMHGHISRIAIILNRQRAYFDQDRENTEILLEDYENAKKVVDYYIINMVRVLNTVKFKKTKYFRKTGEEDFFDNLPQNFKWGDFIKKYKEVFNSSESTANRKLKEWTEEVKILKKARDNSYYRAN